MNTERPTLVIGATGKTGRRILQRLDALGVPTRAGSRPVFDWEDETTWAPALRGVQAVYISYFPDLAVPGAPETIRRLADVALAGGATRLVLLSGRGEDEAQHAEELLQQTAADLTILRCSWFAQNFSEAWMLEPVQQGEVVLPVTHSAEPFVDVEDIADVAVAALTDDRHVGALYELTGPRLLTFAEAVAEIAAATGRAINYAEAPIDAYVDDMRTHGVPEDVIGLTAYLFTEVLDGRNAHLADGVERALGRPPGDFAAYVARTAATGVWS